MLQRMKHAQPGSASAGAIFDGSDALRRISRHAQHMLADRLTANAVGFRQPCIAGGSRQRPA